MGRCERRGPERGERGGIEGLVRLIGEHGSALDYDLITLAGMTLDDVGGALPWAALLHFVEHLPRTSALSRELEPTTDAEMWAAGNANAALLADIYDLLHQLNNNVIARGTGKVARKAKPRPRPWDAPSKGEKRIGSGAIPIADFEKWWNQGGDTPWQEAEA